MSRIHKGYVLQGDDGDNKLVAKLEALDDKAVAYNIVHGAGGNDTITVGHLGIRDLGAALYGDDGDDEIWGDAFIADEHRDTLIGGSGDDTLHAMHANDIIDGGDDMDTLYAGTIVLKAGSVSGIEILHAETLKVVDGDLKQFDEIDARFIFFSHQADLSGLPLTGHVIVHGSAFDDNLDVSLSDARLSIAGGAGDDVIIAGARKATFDGGSGNDTITGGASNDRIDGGKGNDVISGGGGNDTITDTYGTNTVHGGSGNDVLTGGDTSTPFNDPVTRSTANGLFDGGGGDDLFQGFTETSDVTLAGGNGDDTLVFKGDTGHLHVSGMETLELGWQVRFGSQIFAPLTATCEFLNSFERITSQYADDGGAQIRLTDGGALHFHGSHKIGGSILCNDAGNKVDLTETNRSWTVEGGKGDDVIILSPGEVVNSGEAYGWDGDDTLFAGNRGDILRGGEGNDTIYGGSGVDEMVGDGGSDRFVFRPGSSKDTIADFDMISKRHDIIDLSAFQSITSYEDLIKHHISQYGTISLGGGDKIYVYGFDKEHLDPSLFIL